jgi:3-oxoacyl-[acyl-carrier-protein] synthase II
MKKKRIVITGLGVISPIGIGKDAFFRSLMEGKSGIKPITLFETSRCKVRTGGEITDFDPPSILGKRGLLDLDRATKLLLSSAKLLLDDSGFEITESNGPRTGVSVGTTLGSLNSISKFNRESILDGPQFANPSVFPNTVVNSPASRIGIKFKITGFNSTISTGMCSALDALEYACDFIELDRVESVIVGAVEDLSMQTFLGCHKLNYLSGLKGDGLPLSCPFDKRRDGIVLGEGATSFLLEDLENAQRRKADVYAEILGLGSCFGPGKYYKYNYGGEEMVRAMNMALSQADMGPADIDAIFANANSTKDADKIEAKAIKDVFGKKVLVTSIKSFLGETFSASGGFSMASAIGALSNNFIPPVLNYSYRDPDCDLNFAVNGNCRRPVSRVMINTFSPGGGASVAIIGKRK